MNNNGAFGQSSTRRKSTLEGTRIAFYSRKTTVKGQRKKPSTENVIDFLERRGYSSHHLKHFAGQL
jgi:hypothetical protein